MSKILVRPQFFRVLARIASVIINAAFAVILFAIINEDKPQEAATPTIYLLLLAMISSFVAWHWEKAGMIMTATAAAGLSAAAYSSAQAAGLASFSFLAAGLYGFPFMLLSALFFCVSWI